MRVLPDTNVLVSALLFGGLPRRLLDWALQGRFVLVTGDELLDELEDVLRDRFGFDQVPAQDQSLGQRERGRVRPARRPGSPPRQRRFTGEP